MWAEPFADGTPWVAIADMSKGGVVNETTRWVSPAGIASKRLPVGAPGDILYAMYASVGATATLGVSASWNQAILGIAPRPGMADRRFVLYWMQHLTPQMLALVRSNTQDNLNAELVANAPFSSKGIDEQERIADFLDAECARLDRLMELRQRQIELADERSRAKLDAHFDRHRSDRTRARLQHLLKQPPRYGVLVPEFVEGGVPFIRVNELRNVDEGGVPEIAISSIQSAEYRRTIVEPGDLLTSVVGTLGAAAVVSDAARGANVARAVCRLSPSNPDLTWYLRAWLETPAYLTQAKVATGAGAAQPTLNMGDIVKFELGVPTAQEIARAATEARDLLERRRGARRTLNRSLHLLRERKQALITAAVTGEFDVSAASGRGL